MSKSPLIPDEDAAAESATKSEAAIDRILRRGARAEALGADDTHSHGDSDGDQLDLAERSALRRVSGLSTELEDITEYLSQKKDELTEAKRLSEIKNEELKKEALSREDMAVKRLQAKLQRDKNIEVKELIAQEETAK